MADSKNSQGDIHLGLERILILLDLLGNPQDTVPAVHVVGTNGKGSVCAYLASICKQAGVKTGRYLSPELLGENECISIDLKDIRDEQLKQIRMYVEKMIPEVEKRCGQNPTPFEIATASAFMYFQQEACSLMLIEAGMGGRGDATNVLSSPLLALFTRIDKDHEAFLGSDITDIATDKAGILKSNTQGVSVSQQAEAWSGIEAYARQVGAQVAVIEVPEDVRSDEGKYQFKYRGLSLSPSLRGEHQIENACLAVEAALRLQQSFPQITQDTIQKGIASTCHPGRLEFVTSRIYFDGAHNPNGMKALIDSLPKCFPYKEVHLIFAVMKDKNYTAMLSYMKKYPCSFTQVSCHPRALSAELLTKEAERLGIHGSAYDSLLLALQEAPKDKIIVVCGSLFLYKELLSCQKMGNIL